MKKKLAALLDASHEVSKRLGFQGNIG